MAFNWFRRQYTQPEDSSEPTVEQTERTSESDPEAKESETEADAVQEDYLAWAKAAYQNIQERQQPAEVNAPEASVSSVDEKSSVDLEINPEVENAPELSNTSEPAEVEIAEMPTVASAEATSLLPLFCLRGREPRQIAKTA